MAAATPPLTIAGHSVALVDRAGGMLSLRVALNGRSFLDLARTLGKLDGVRVTGGPESTGRDRCYVAHCPGFKMVVSCADDNAEFALALVSRAPQAALVVMSDVGAMLEHLMTAPSPTSEVVPPRPSTPPPTSLRRSALASGKPLARKTPLQRRTPLGRGRFK
jgi:hypothetical protein